VTVPGPINARGNHHPEEADSGFDFIREDRKRIETLKVINTITLRIQIF
jgi:hypothetical protein